MNILVDTNSGEDLFAELLEEKGYEVKRIQIKPSGDIAFGTTKYSHSVIIERKAIEDFDGGFADNNPHIWDQLQRMQEFVNDSNRERTRRAFLIIIGNSDFYNSFANVTWKQRIRAVGSMLGRYPNVQITFVDNETSFIELVDKLYQNLQDGKFGKGRDLPFKSKTYGEFSEYILNGIPGIGKEKAKEIDKYFKVKWELVPRGSEVVKLEDVDGIGTKTAEKIRKWGK